MVTNQIPFPIYAKGQVYMKGQGNRVPFQYL